MIKIEQKLNNLYFKNSRNIAFKNNYTSFQKNKNANYGDVFIKNNSSPNEARTNSDKTSDLIRRNRNICFSAKSAKKQEIEPDCFFVRMRVYKKKDGWANGMVETTKKVSEMVQNKEDFDNILKFICGKISSLNENYRYGYKREDKYDGYMGIRIDRGDDFRRGSIEYFDRYEEKLKTTDNKKKPKFRPKTNKKYHSANTCWIAYEQSNYYPYTDKDKIIVHYGWINNRGEMKTNTNLDICEKAYNELKSKEKPTEKEILDTCAVIQWLIAQECPYMHGNDSIANIITKGIMHAYDIKISPLKEGVSLDFEAFYRDLDEYIENYPTFFEKYPEKLIR